MLIGDRRSVNDMSLSIAPPISGVGDMIHNFSPATANFNYGWIRPTTGSLNVGGVDSGNYLSVEVRRLAPPFFTSL